MNQLAPGLYRFIQQSFDRCTHTSSCTCNLYHINKSLAILHSRALHKLVVTEEYSANLLPGEIALGLLGLRRNITRRTLDLVGQALEEVSGVGTRRQVHVGSGTLGGALDVTESLDGFALEILSAGVDAGGGLVHSGAVLAQKLSVCAGAGGVGTGRDGFLGGFLNVGGEGVLGFVEEVVYSGLGVGDGAVSSDLGVPLRVGLHGEYGKSGLVSCASQGWKHRLVHKELLTFYSANSLVRRHVDRNNIEKTELRSMLF